MANFPLSVGTKYSVGLKNGGNVNIEMLEKGNASNVVTGKMFAVVNEPIIYIDQSEISTVVEVPVAEVENLIKIAKQQHEQWQKHAAGIGVEGQQGSYI